MNLSTIKDLNSLSSEGVLLVLAEIFIPKTPTIRVVRNNENIRFKDREFVAFPFEISGFETNKGEAVSFKLIVDNTSGAFARYILAYDEMLKSGESEPVRAKIYIVNTLDLENEIISESFELSDFFVDSQNVTFNLSTANLFSLTYPRRKMYKDFCPFKFKGAECGYSGNALTCDKSLVCCRKLANSTRFGGFLGINGAYKS